jgi:hypothetical protein
MPHAYTEDQLVEQPAIGLFAELGWQTVSVSLVLMLVTTAKLVTAITSDISLLFNNLGSVLWRG